MKTLKFNSTYSLVKRFGDEFKKINDDYPTISVYGKFDIIRELLECLIAQGYYISYEIQLESYEVSNYDKEFVLYIDPDGVIVQKLFVDGRYLSGGGDVSFVHEDCSSTLLKYIDSEKVYEFGYEDDEDDDFSEECMKCDKETCCGCVKESGKKPVDTATTKGSFKVNGKYVDKETFEKELTRFEDKYMDNIRDMLLKYADFMDDWNDWLKLLY